MRRLARFICMLVVSLSSSFDGRLRATEIADVFGDHMVLQAGRAIPLWGRTRPAQEIYIRFGENAWTTKSDGEGRWRVLIGPLLPDANGKELRVVGAETQVLRDVLVGEVWLCSGQSNMRYRLGRPTNDDAKTREVPFASEVARAHAPQIRLLNVSGGTPAERKWAAVSPESVESFSAIGYFFGRRLAAELAVPIGLVDLGKGGAPIRAFHRPGENSGAPTSTDDVSGKVFQHDVSWFAPYAVRGVLWYQGESDVARAAKYPELLSQLIADWRGALENPELPFFLVQLPIYERKPDAPAKGSGRQWAELREAQRLVASRTAQTWLVPALDLGERFEIHPRRKLELANRLADSALATIYGRPIAAAAPQLVDVTREASRVVLRFSPTVGGLVASDGEVRNLEFWTADGRAVPSTGRIDGLDRVVAQVPDNLTPTDLSYGWNDYFQPSLFDGRGLPALPFRVTMPRVQ